MFLVHKRGLLNKLDDPEDFKLVTERFGYRNLEKRLVEVNESGRHTIFVVSVAGKPL